MTWPPTVPPPGRTNSTPQADAHPGDHNQISGALSDIINHAQGVDATLAAQVMVGHQVHQSQGMLAGGPMPTGQWNALAGVGGAFTAVAGHRYDVSFYATVQSTTTGWAALAFTGGGLVGGNNHNSFGFPVVAASFGYTAHFRFFVGPGLAASFPNGGVITGISANVAAGGSVSALGPAGISVIDLGVY